MCSAAGPVANRCSASGFRTSGRRCTRGSGRPPTRCTACRRSVRRARVRRRRRSLPTVGRCCAWAPAAGSPAHSPATDSSRCDALTDFGHTVRALMYGQAFFGPHDRRPMDPTGKDVHNATTFDLSTVFRTVAQTAPEHPFLVWRDRRLSYGETDARIDGFARYLVSRGLGCHTERAALAGHESGQDHLGLYLRNGNQYLEAMIGSYRARVAPFNVN